jgi:hypothetical protein
MAKNYDSTDLLWTSRGDFYIANGDLMDTEHDPLRSLMQEIKNRASSDQGDWSVFPDLGATPSRFVGEPNNKETAESIKVSILSALTRNGYIHTRDVEIKYMPVSRTELLFRLNVLVAPTVANANSESLTVHGLYRYEEDQVAFII